MRGLKEELWENLVVVWPDAMRGAWCVAEVINHRASEDPSAPKYVTHAELVNGALREDAIFAESKQEALLRYAASGRCRVAVWSVDGFYGAKWLYIGEEARMRRYRLVKEDF